MRIFRQATSVALAVLLSLTIFSCDRQASKPPLAPEALWPPQAAPVLIAPYNGMTGNRLQVTLRWEEVPGAQWYHVQIARDGAFSQMTYDEPGIGGDLMGYGGLEINTTYFWRVRGVNPDGEGPWSEVWSFCTGDGSSPGTIEGTWELVEGNYWWNSGMMDPWGEILNITGNVVFSLGLGSGNLEGLTQNYKIGWQYYTSNVLYHMEWSDSTDEEDTYAALSDSLLYMDFDFFQSPWSPTSDTLQYSINADTLRLILLSTYDEYTWPAGQFIFNRI